MFIISEIYTSDMLISFIQLASKMDYLVLPQEKEQDVCYIYPHCYLSDNPMWSTYIFSHILFFNNNARSSSYIIFRKCSSFWKTGYVLVGRHDQML